LAVAISALRNPRRGGLGIAETVRFMDARIAAQFGPDKFVTGIVGAPRSSHTRRASCRTTPRQ
jgi:hypothetical protein